MNYTNLIIDGVTLDGKNLVDPDAGKYVLSNNNGTTIIKNNSSIIAAIDGVAFDADKQDSYGDVSVIVENSNVFGEIVKGS